MIKGHEVLDLASIRTTAPVTMILDSYVKKGLAVVYLDEKKRGIPSTAGFHIKSESERQAEASIFRNDRVLKGLFFSAEKRNA